VCIEVLHFSLPFSQEFFPVVGIWAIDQARRADARLQKTLTSRLWNTGLVNNVDTGTVALIQDCFAGSINIDAWMTPVQVDAFLLFDVI
jgi:hypothetical protein